MSARTFRSLAAALTLCCLSSFPRLAGQPATLPLGMEKVELADGVYLFRVPPDGYARANTTVIINDRDVVVFDSNVRPSTTRLVLAEIRKLTDKPVRYVINSHWHPDHWTGNSVYTAEFPGVQIIATEETLDIMKRVAPAWPTVFAGSLKRREAALADAIKGGKNPDGTAFTGEQRRETENSVELYRSFVGEQSVAARIFPNLLYRDRLTFFSGTREFRLSSQSGDALSSTVLYLPKEKVLLMGDLLVSPIPWGTNSYQITPWINSLKALAALDIKAIVPGHGAAFRDKDYLNLVIELFESVVTQVHAALEEGAVTVDDVQKAVNLDSLRARFTHGDADLEADFIATMPGLIKIAYKESRDGMESRR